MLLAVTIWRTTPLPTARVLATMALLTAVAALGPYAHVLGYRISTAPWMLFYRLPFLAAMLPGRFSLYAWLSLTLLLALWLAQPGSTWRRYALAGLCLASLLPAQSTARNWRQPVLPPVFTTLPPGAHVLVLPVFAQEMGWQYASGMRFMLVGQGYIGNGRPAPFTNWPLYPALWENRFPDIDPQAFSAYLQNYDVQDVVLLSHGYAYYGGKPVDEAAETRRGNPAATGGLAHRHHHTRWRHLPAHRRHHALDPGADHCVHVAGTPCQTHPLRDPPCLPDPPLRPPHRPQPRADSCVLRSPCAPAAAGGNHHVPAMTPHLLVTIALLSALAVGLDAWRSGQRPASSAPLGRCCLRRMGRGVPRLPRHPAIA